MSRGRSPEALHSRFGRLLRFWREVFGISQERLALDLQSSTRHISRLENGLVQPSRAMVTKLSSYFELGERDASQLAFAAGYAVATPPIDYRSEELRWLRKAMAYSIGALDPYPAMMTDGSDKILMFNRSWLAMMSGLLPPGDDVSIRVYYELLFDSAVGEGRPDRWEVSQSGILMALLRDDRALQDLVEELVTRHDVPSDWRTRAARTEPIASVAISISRHGKVWKFYQLTMAVSLRGPTAYGVETPPVIHVLFPRHREHEFTAPSDQELEHPLLCENLL